MTLLTVALGHCHGSPLGREVLLTSECKRLVLDEDPGFPSKAGFQVRRADIEDVQIWRTLSYMYDEMKSAGETRPFFKWSKLLPFSQRQSSSRSSG